ncbi:MAG: matrixin family metalloprotease [Candidatus Rokubacteria bacterium]|nr:matrixin family metalloprotease [Candidatus Rokubacteria bacterium]
MKPQTLWKVSLVLWGLGLLFSSGASAYELTGQDWTYQTSPMGEDWSVCTSSMPSSGSARTKDGAYEWNYSFFTFTFGADFTGCSSYPNYDGTNQADYGSGLGASTLAETTWYYTISTGDILECDMRFSNTFTWYTGTGTPASNQYDWWSVAAHEMGHCLGLAHEPDITTPKPVMYPTFAAGEVRRVLTSDDTAGRNAIYGAACASLAFASKAPSLVASLPAAIWLALPILFVAAWKLSLKRKKGAADGRSGRM